jgi:hypothetical protein
MTAEWMFDESDISKIYSTGYQTEDIETVDYKVAKYAQHKLLQHLMKQAQVNEITEGFMVTSLYIKELKDMLSQLEAK